MATPPSQEKKHILILGAGVTGLSTALALLTDSSVAPNPKYTITILAEYFPTDRNPEYTSPWAGGHWRSHVGISAEEERVRKWDARTYGYWSALLSSPSSSSTSTEAREEELGLGFRESRNFWGVEGPETSNLDGSGLWWSSKNQSAVQDFRILGGEERLQGAVMGISYRSICFDPVRYITYLFERVQYLGAQIIRAKVPTEGGLQGVVGHALPLSPSEIFALVNCTGLGARHFVSTSEAEKLFPVRGQTMLICGEASIAQTLTDPPGMQQGDILYVVPRPGSGTTIFGGCKQVASWDMETDESLNQRIIENVKKHKLAEGLKDDHGEFTVVAKQVGFRPGRKGGPRVEVEGRDKIGGVWVVHSYGHAGGGFQASWGCAEEIVELVEGLGE